MPALEDFGLNTKELLAEQNRETMGKLIAAEKTIERLRAAVDRSFDIALEALTTGAPGLGDPVRVAIAQNIKRRLRAFEQSAPEKQEG